MGVTNDEDAQADDRNASPAKEIYFFTEEQESKNSDYEIGKSGSGLNVTVICPSKNKHVSDEKTEQAADSQPDIA